MLFGAPKVTTTLLIDISSSSVGAAYAARKEGDAPVLVHAVRKELREFGQGPTALLRVLDAALQALQQEGGPKHYSFIGESHAREALVCVGAPWQESSVIVKTVEKDKEFTFTKAMLEEALKEEEGRSLLIASLLNGYETALPIGKKVKRADTIVLRSHIPEELYTVIRKAVRGALGSDEVHFVSFGQVARAIVTITAPKEHDYLALRVSGDSSEAALVRRGLLSGVCAAGSGTNAFHAAARSSGAELSSLEEGPIDRTKSARMAERLSKAQGEWVAALRECLTTLAHGSALPRSLYLFAEPGTAKFIARLFDTPELHALWLSDEPLEIVLMEGTTFDAFLHRTSEEGDDAFLDAMSLPGRN